MSVEYIFSIAGVFTVAHIYICIYIVQIRKVSLQILVDHRIDTEGSAAGFDQGGARVWVKNLVH